jgi:hypothetical protein
MATNLANYKFADAFSTFALVSPHAQPSTTVSNGQGGGRCDEVEDDAECVANIKIPIVSQMNSRLWSEYLDFAFQSTRRESNAGSNPVAPA